MAMTLLACITAAGMLIDMRAYRSADARADREILVALLQRARGEAIHNMCTAPDCVDGVPHGVHIEPGRFVLFEGALYRAEDVRNAVFMQRAATTSTDIIFSQLAATTTSRSISIVGEGYEAIVSVSCQGRIDWDD